MLALYFAYYNFCLFTHLSAVLRNVVGLQACLQSQLAVRLVMSIPHTRIIIS